MIPHSLQDIHYRMYLDYLEVQNMAKQSGVDGSRFMKSFLAEPEFSRLKAVERLVKGTVKFLEYFDSYHTETSRMEAKIAKMLTKKGRVFKFIYTLPDEDGHLLIVSKVRIHKWEPWRRQA